MTVVYLLLGFFLIAGEFGRTIWREVRIERAEAEARTHRVGRHRAAEVATVVEPLEKLPRRPEGRQALKAEIAQAEYVEMTFTPVRFEEPAPFNPKPTVPRWNVAQDWHTGEFEIAWQEFFGQEPDNLAVSREWAGVGTVAG